MTTGFLSQENAKYISNTFQKFMKDKYERSIVLNEDYYKLLTETMKNVYSKHSTSGATLSAINMITITEMKKHYSEERVAFSEDDVFFNKLQQLELSRKTFTPSIEPPTKPPVAEPLQIQSINTIYMPAPVKIGKEIKIASWERNWLEEPNRNYFTWKGPLPRFVDRTTTRVGCVICYSDRHQMVSLIIEGANEDEVSVSLIPSHTIGIFTIYKPILETLSYLKLLSLPWKVSLETCDGEKIDYGVDNIVFRVIYSSEKYSTIECECDWDIGDMLRIFTKKQIVSKILRKGEGLMDVEGYIDTNGTMLNYSRQISIVLEMTTTDHKQ
jgi:hypothetical protein